MNATAADALHLIASRLKEARLRKYPSAAAAARALGMNEVTLRAHETGQNGIPVDVMIKYVRAYGIDVNWLLRGQHEKEFQYDRDIGISLPVSGMIAAGTYIDPEIEREPLPPLVVPEVDRFFGFEIYRMRGGEWAPRIAQGSHLICTPADTVKLHAQDLVVVERERAGLCELTLWMLGVDRSGEAILSGPSGSPQVILTGPGAASGVQILSFVRQVVTDLDRTPFDEMLRMELPVRKRPDEPL
jgi:transcriptional regulator with XRE-family HTH domain